MHYEGHIIRPPSEAGSILLQVTVGCSHGKCTFCGSYQGVRFNIKPDDIIMADIRYAAAHFMRQRRVFLCDGDALIIPQARLVRILQAIRESLPWVTRVGTYANAKSIHMKTDAELRELARLGLGIVYIGLESGDDQTLKAVRKGADAGKIVRMGQKAKVAGLKVSVTVLLGIAGKARSSVHGAATGRALSEMDPDYVGALSLMLIPGTLLYQDAESGRFVLPEACDLLKELRGMLAATHLSRGLFHANHASNYLPLKLRMPKDREKGLALIDEALAGRIPLMPENMRAL